MVAQEILDLLVRVRVLVPEPFFWRYGQEAKTSPSQGEIMGSIPISATNSKQNLQVLDLGIFYFCQL